MNSIELTLLDLVGVAESPVYSAYRWMGRELGRSLAIGEFIGLVEGMVEDEVLRLWSVDATTHERSLCNTVPRDLAERYEQVADPDPRYDPFGLSLTPGPAADPNAPPQWTVDFDFVAQSFTLVADLADAEGASRQIRRLYPDRAFLVVDREVEGTKVRITGSIEGLESPSA